MNTSIYTDPSSGQRYLVVAIEVPACVPLRHNPGYGYMEAWAAEVGKWLEATRAHDGPPEPTAPELGELTDAGPWLVNLASRCRRRTMSKWVWMDKQAQAERRADEAEKQACELAKELGEAGKAVDQAREFLQLIRDHNPGLSLPSPEALKFRDYYKAQEAKGAPVPPEDGGPYCGACDGTRQVVEHKLSAIDGFSIPQQTGRMITCPTCRPDGEQPGLTDPPDDRDVVTD